MNAHSFATLFVFALGASAARADIICNAVTRFGPARIAIGPKAVVVSGAALVKPHIFNTLSGTYDGHMTSLVTGPGIAVSYENWYGCIHNAHITTNFSDSNEVGYIEHVEVAQCSGGSSSDELCRISGAGKPLPR